MEQAFIIFLIIIFGLEFGSFANVCIYRWPKGLSVIRPHRSFCPWCKHSIAWYDNIPVLSFVILSGKCRNCHSLISWRYPAVELTVPLAWLLIYSRFPALTSVADVALLSGFFILAFVLIITTLTDIDWKIIPDQATYGIMALGFTLSPFNFVLGANPIDRMVLASCGILIGGGIPLALSWIGAALLGKEVLGLGDVKLLGGIGAFLGWEGALLAFVGGSMIGGVLAGIALLMKLIKRNQYLPFGPFINIAAYLLLLSGLSSPHSLRTFLGFFSISAP